MEKAYAKFGAWRASVRDTRLKDVMVRKGQKVSKKKRTKKEPLVQKTFFFAQACIIQKTILQK